MYINLYPNKEKSKTKKNLLLLGFFFFAGGAYAFFRETVLQDTIRVNWVIGAVVIFIAGILSIFMATDRIWLKDAYFSMQPDYIKFRLSFFSKEHMLRWSQIQQVRISKHFVLFELNNQEQVELKLGAIQSDDVARQVTSSLRLAALDHQIAVNGVKMHEHTINS
ncbi:hypothetical protein [Pontibacter sp. SGAir0037]|uniref:hypothetical protein n=1 Tax=Pontibacter sp. SGAir0037 TaxID=2571030 RepID=UPI0010CD129C|nr:hypothetical protein [Pontibacter sp. SGAir0037]QCR24741.1 hypothetical protein C1N53_21885 [Pontibacter sp. SGAir0037]